MQVMAAQANFVRIKIDRLDGSDAPPPQPRLLCVVRALLKKMKREVLVGDRVRVVGIDWTDGRGMVEEVLQRDTRLFEPPVANVNHVLLVFSSTMPPLQPSAATRYLVAAEAAGLPITVVLNKADLLGSPEEVRREEERITAWGYTTISVSVVDELGLDELEKTLQGRVTVVAGPSGAGKSSIINALRLRAVGVSGTLENMDAQPSGQVQTSEEEHEDEEEECTGSNNDVVSTYTATPGVELQAVGSISERIGRGKHTTRNVMLVEMGSGGLLVDTPGFNQPSVVLPPTELGQYFPEIRSALEKGRCGFSNCQHISEPGCVVKGDWERYDLYAILHAELQGLDEENVKRAVEKRQREGTARMKSRGGGKMGVEARLVTKTHRRVSRRSVKQQLSEIVRDVDEDDAISPS
jgi:ribosome biogenesis GTPase